MDAGTATNGPPTLSPGSGFESGPGPLCLVEGCGLPAFKRGLCSRCDAERRKYQKMHPEVTDADLVKAKLLAPKTPPPGRRKGTAERKPLWLPLAAVRLSSRRWGKATPANGT